MTIGIESVATYLPENRRNNLERLAEFETDETFLREKLGILEIAVASETEQAADMCAQAFRKLETKLGALDRGAIDAVVVVTQTPGENIPHVSAEVHGQLELGSECACFDVSLGCSGYVYGLNILKSLMEANGYEKGLLFTADPYSKIVDSSDKNTSLLFGDAATVTVLSRHAQFTIGRSTAHTMGKEYNHLTTRGGILQMNGRAVFNFCAREVPADIRKAAEINGVALDSIDRFLLHQGSRFIVETIADRLDLPREKVAFGIEHYGNTVSSSIPLLLESELENSEARQLMISGFGVGLSWASTILTRRKHPIQEHSQITKDED